MKIVTEVEITPQMLADQMVTFMESPYGEWCSGVKKADKWNGPAPWYAEGGYFNDTFNILLTCEDPNGGPDQVKALTEADFQKGLSLMAQNARTHFTDIINESGDAITADIMMQFIVYEEEVYG